MNFEDVDFTKDPNYVRGDITPTGEKFAGIREYGDEVPTIEESDWKGLVDKMEEDGGGAERLIVNVFNQRNEGSCVANACAQAMQIVQARQFGKANVTKLSAMSLYKRIGSGPNSGASVNDGLSELKARGILPLDTPENKAKYEHTFPATGWSNKLPSGWEDVGKRFKAVEWFVLRGLDQMMTALLHEHPVVVGRSGHSICYCKPTYKSGKLGVTYVNSWGDWGFGAGDFTSGFGFDSLSMVKSAASWAFCVRAVTDPAG